MGTEPTDPPGTDGGVPENEKSASLRRKILVAALAIAATIHEFLVPYTLTQHILSAGVKVIVLGTLFYLFIIYKPNPLTQKKLARFRSIKRGYYSFIILAALLLVSFFGKLLVDKRALIVKYEGKLYFPTYTAFHPGTDFGLDYNYEVNYRDL